MAWKGECCWNLCRLAFMIVGVICSVFLCVVLSFVDPVVGVAL